MSPTKLSKQNIARVVACSLTAIAISAPATVAYPADAVDSNQQQASLTQDVRSPDARDAASPQPVAVVATDLRSSDARDAASPQPVAVVATDLRSPDATDDAARSPSEPAPAASSAPSGFDWSTAGISVAALVGLLLFALATATLVRHGRGPVAR